MSDTRKRRVSYDSRTRRPKKRSYKKWLLFSLVVASICAFSATSFARDRDGTKIQARNLETDRSHADTLEAPGDLADWYYIKVDSSRYIELSVSTTLFVDVAIIDSSNEERWRATKVSGETSKSLAVEPGIYFIVVSTSDGIQAALIKYRIRVQLKDSLGK